MSSSAATGPSGTSRARHALSKIPGVGVAGVPFRLAGFGAQSWVRHRAVSVYPQMPSAAPRPNLLAQAMLDEAIVGAMKTPGRMPTAEDYARVGEELRAARTVLERGGYVADPVSFHDDPTPPKLVHSSKAKMYGLHCDKLSWDSGYVPMDGLPAGERWLAAKQNRTAHAIAIRHSEPGRPWLVLLHGLGTGFGRADLFAFAAEHMHKELGYNLLLPVMPLHGPRRSSLMSGASFLSFDLVSIVHGVAQAVWDTRRALAYLRDTEDATDISLHGISLGGLVASLVAGLDDGLRAVVAGVPLVDVPQLFTHHCPPHIRRQAVSDGLLGETAHAVHSVVSPLSFSPRVAHEGRFIYAGLADRMTTPEQAHKLWMHWDRPTADFYPGSHLSFMWSKRARSFVDAALSPA